MTRQARLVSQMRGEGNLFNFQRNHQNSIFKQRSRDMKQKIMHKILESSSKKQQQQQTKNPRLRIASLDMGTHKIQQFNEQSQIQQSNSQLVINSLQEELRNLNKQISQIQKHSQTNEMIQLEMKNNLDNQQFNCSNKENQFQDLKQSSNSKEMLEFKQISLQRYKQLLGELKDLLQLERNDIIKDIQVNMDQDYDKGIKTIKASLEEISYKKNIIQHTYNLQKSEIDNLSERKAMLKEDLNGKLMQRAELVAQREYLDEILEEFRQKYKQEIDYIEDENKMQVIINNQNQANQQLNLLKKQKQQVCQTLLSQIYQKNDQLFDFYQVLCNSYLVKFEQITLYNNTMKSLEGGISNIFSKYNIPTFNDYQELKANRQNVNHQQTNEDTLQNWQGFSHLNFTDKRRFKDEFFKLKAVHKQRLKIFSEWCEYIYKIDTSQKLQMSLVKKVLTAPPQKLTSDSFPSILQSFCEDKGVPNFEQEKIMSIFNQYQTTLLDQNNLLDEDRCREQEQMEKIENQEQEILVLQDKKKQMEKEQFILEEEYQQSIINLKQNQQMLQQKRAILDHTLHLQADTAFGEYLNNEKQIFLALEKTYGMKACSQIKKEHHKQFVDKIKETQNKRINQLKKIFSDLIHLNKNIEINLSYVENTLFVELNNIESQLITFRKSLEIKEKELQQIISKEHEQKLKLSIINEAKKIFFDNILKVETTNVPQIIFTNNGEQHKQIKSGNQDNSQIRQGSENNSNVLKPKIQNYFSTERTFYMNSQNENPSQDKGRQYNTIDQIGQKESIDPESYRITDIRNGSQHQSTIEGCKYKSKSMFSTIDCTSIDEQNYEGNVSSSQRQPQFYYNLKATKHFGSEAVSKSLDNSRRSSMIPITFNSKRQSLNAIVSNQPIYSMQNQGNNNSSQNYIVQYNRGGGGNNQQPNSIQNYMPFAQQQLSINKSNQMNTSVNNSIHHQTSQNSNILQARSPNIPNMTTNRDIDENQSNPLKDQLSRFQHKIVKFNLNNTQLKHISILEAIKPLLEGREIYKRIGGNQHGSGSSTINQHKNQYNPFSLENTTPEQCGYVLRVAHLNRHLTKIEFKNYQFGQKGQKQIVHSLDACISVDHMLRVVVPPTTLDLIKFQKHFDVIGNVSTNINGNKGNVDTINSSQLYASTTMNTYNTLKQNDQSFVNNTNVSFNNNQSNNYFTLNSNAPCQNGNNTNGTMTNFSNLSMIHDQNLKMDKIMNGNLYPFQIIMDKGNRLDLIAEGYETYRVWVNCINTLIKHRKSLNQIKTKIEFIIL